MEQPGKIDIVRSSCSYQEDYITIRVMDSDAVLISEASISLSDFSLALTGQGHINCKVKTYKGKNKE